MTTGLRVCTVTGATCSVIAAGNSGGIGLGTEIPTACIRFSGTAVPLSRTTSSHTTADCAGPTFVVGVGDPMTRVQYGSCSADRFNSATSRSRTVTDVNVTSCESALVTWSS